MSKKLEPGMAYDTKKLNKVFAFLSILFLAVTFWLFLDDYVRPWKAVQIKAMKIKKAKIEEKLKKAQAELDPIALEEQRIKLEEGKEIVKTRRESLKKVDREIANLNVRIKEETIINGTLNGNVSALGFNYGVSHSKHKNDADKLFKELQKKKKLFAESKDRLKSYQSALKVQEKQRDELTKEVIVAKKNIKDITSKRDLTKKAKDQLKMDGVFALRNAPFFDFMDPTLKIRQVVLNNITDDRYFQHVPKVDRCMTCHTFIDQPGYEDEENPFKTHPNMDLMVGLKSPHPVKKFGCTTCHGGEGHRVNDFNSAAHTPRDDEQREEWVKKYNWHEPHKIPHPMFKVGQTEASCIKCHKGDEFIPGAELLNEGKQKIEKYGCYACHKIEGWEGKRNPGPSLHKISSKVSKKFFKNWVWAPKTFNKHAYMPSFFAQSNNSEPEFMKKNIAEVNAMAEFIFQESESYVPFAKYVKGDAGNGKELLSQVGCISCHGIEGLEEQSNKVNGYAGPYLTATGSKIKDPNWLVSWLKKPSHYQKDTIMPSFRLSDKEANDIATYLLSLKNEKFNSLTFEPMDGEIRDEILTTYFSAFDTLKVAKEKIAKMSDREKTLELGKRSIGKYGCYSCHSIKGFEGRTPIGPELSKVGSKPLSQFGFNHVKDVEHSRSGWIKAHLMDPKRWDEGMDKPFKDLSRMPNLYMSKDEAESITLYLLGLVSDYMPLAGVKRLNSSEQIVADGMNVINKYNCMGCHKVDGYGGDILGMYEDDINEGPPMLVGHGHRVKTDWFNHFLKNVYPIRPNLSVRMPSFNFSNEERNKIVSMFQHKAKQPTFEDVEVIKWAPGERAEAVQLFNALACTSCHSAGFEADVEPSAPNLYFAKRKLRKSWIKKWLRNPQSIYPETVMPNFWEDGEALEPSYFNGNVDEQIEALTKYIIEIGTNKLPAKGMNFWGKP